MSTSIVHIDFAVFAIKCKNYIPSQLQLQLQQRQCQRRARCQVTTTSVKKLKSMHFRRATNPPAHPSAAAAATAAHPLMCKQNICEDLHISPGPPRPQIAPRRRVLWKKNYIIFTKELDQ